MLAFDGFQGIGVRLSRLSKQSEAESLVLRLQTYQKNVLLFESSSTSSTAPDRFGVEIADQQIVIFYNLGFDTKVSFKCSGYLSILYRADKNKHY